MLTTEHQAKYRSDYRAPAFTIETVELTFHLHEKQTRVINSMRIQRQTPGAFELDGEQLKLVRIELDGSPLTPDDYQLTATGLILDGVPDSFLLTIETEIDPASNTALEGLYKSDGAFCTQCEAEGFRRITYYLDRPDVLAVFTTTIIADKARYPYLLSNGNRVGQGEGENGQHWITWHDPFPKPAYLFALVAGDFDVHKDTFKTVSGRTIDLHIFVDRGNLERARYAMTALQNSMRWDEQRFGLEYDLDIYMIVAVDFFNMGAMENKGLNIFNSRYVLADQQTATDQDFLAVESVIGHEYFHNWTGNRITCRDWFQLSLKEGLTVFRDQEFSSDLGSRAVNRIQDIRIIRSHQFNEDASPMAHPIRPDKVIEMNNFYTVTVYNKGAEVIRMLHTLLGEEGFQRGMRRYVECHDGQAVTCEDFVAAMEQANNRDFSLFRRWYSQAGTPMVSVRSEFNSATGQVTLSLQQQTPATAGQTDKHPVHIPLLLSAYDKEGQPLTLQTDSGSLTRHESGSYLLELTDAEQTFVLTGLSEAPVFSLLENFSAPVRLNYHQPLSELLVLLAHAEAEVTRWEAAQSIYLQLLKEAITSNQDICLTDELIAALKRLARADIDPALRALALSPPTAEELAEHYPAEIPVTAIAAACRQLKQAIATALQHDFKALYENYCQSDYELSGTAIAARSLCNLSLYYLCLAAPDQYSKQLVQHFRGANNMTDQQAALQTAVHLNLPCKQELLSAFGQQWQDEPLVLDKWFAVQASSPYEASVEQVSELQGHRRFTLTNPNRVYSLLATFSRNLVGFHHPDGTGYKLIGNVIAQLNSTNPQVASRLLTPFTQWRRFDSSRQKLMRHELERLQQLPDLAADLAEKIESSLEP
ncbi:aminopeptidase N [Pseudidiomarina salinarum]|uniref:Aminopeptidase N n=1 Tax=Pseudidiomarina salinarum TaxID=435908 RepID=A0A094IW09_9GAMM|nr:aminopeptidase N [Pseudidiomarina salinarum]KFZ31850.1 aminopeptidase N [Pseudidiomarina salinarum]RUO70378.1 aminopeptidase N [Pseudidiomarina salinarum]